MNYKKYLYIVYTKIDVCMYVYENIFARFCTRVVPRVLNGMDICDKLSGNTDIS